MTRKRSAKHEESIAKLAVRPEAKPCGNSGDGRKSGNVKPSRETLAHAPALDDATLGPKVLKPPMKRKGRVE